MVLNMDKNEFLQPAVNLIDKFASEKTKKLFEYDDLLYSISIVIIDYRIKNNLSQHKLAKILGMHQSMISRLESCRYNPSIQILWYISKKIDISFNIQINNKEGSI